MRKKILFSIAALYCFTSVWSQRVIYKDSKKPVEERVTDLLQRMTLQEKILQLNQYTFGENNNPNNIGPAIQNLPAGIGSLIYFSTNPELRNKIQRKAMEESRLGIPILFGFDVIHGLRTVYPIPLAQACSFNPPLVEKACAIAAKESVLSGIDWTFSPMIDVARDARWGRISECYGEDTYLNGILGLASVNGYQGKNLSDTYSIAACLKHFVGYGVSEGGRDYRYTDISSQSLWETYLPPYEICVKGGAATLMSAFNDISGIPATANHYTLTEILKEQWKHDGFVVADWNAVEQLMYQGVAKDKKEAGLKAFMAGVEMDMRDNIYFEHLEQLVNEKKVPIEKINDAVARVLRLKFRLGLFDEPYVKVIPEQERYLKKEDVGVALQLAEETMVLLKNKDNVLPLHNSVKRVAIIGPMAKNKSNLLGSWSFNGQESDVESLYEGFEKEFEGKVELAYAEGCLLDGDDESLFDEALKTAEKADVVVACIGEHKKWSGENASRSTLSLPAIQEKLIMQLKKAGKPIILVLSSGRPLELIRLEPMADAILEIWQPGIAGGTPLAGIISGRINPSGKLAVTFPLTTGQIPTYYNMRQSSRPFQQLGDYQDLSAEPLYWFGQGLSYTTFEYSNAKLSAKKISRNQKIIAEVEVTNSGGRSGKETALWYISDPVSTLSRPMKELKYFEKKELKPGEKKVFHFEITPMRDLSYPDVNGKRIVENGDFIVQIGNQKLTFEVED